MNAKHVLTHAETMEDVKMFRVILSANARMAMNRIQMGIIAETSMSVQERIWTYVQSQVKIWALTQDLEKISKRSITI